MRFIIELMYLLVFLYFSLIIATTTAGQREKMQTLPGNYKPYGCDTILYFGEP